MFIDSLYKEQISPTLAGNVSKIIALCSVYLEQSLLRSEYMLLK